MIKFDISDADANAVQAIVERFENFDQTADRLSLTMDLTACAANGCPMKFDELLAADDFNFVHDVGGIRRHMDRTTGQLTDCFLPRYAK